MTIDYKNLVNICYNSTPKYTEIQAGLPEDYKDIRTLGDLLAIHYKVIHAKEQLRRNLTKKLKNHDVVFPGIIGFNDDVLPALIRAILSEHDVFLIGKIGQAKTKLVQTIAETLLSPMPIIQQSITNDCPLDLPPQDLLALLEDREINSSTPTFHISPESAKKIRDNKLDTKINWVEGIARFKYVLATPDISVKDLVGYIDVVKVAKKGVEMYKIESYSPGQLMQAKHGIICIDELPVLDPRKQVSFLSVLQEGRFTTGAYPVIFEPKTIFFATANPIDYTHSGKVIEPLYDRLKSHIHTHYPKTITDEMLIICQEAKITKSFIPTIILKALAKIIHKTRQSPQINQERGVSVRLGIHGLELLVGEALRTRAIFYDILPTPRFTDFDCLTQVAKFELEELEDTVENRQKLFKNLISESIKEICLEFYSSLNPDILNSIKNEFTGKSFYASQQTIWKNGGTSYENQLVNFPIFYQIIKSKKDEFLNVQKDFVSLCSVNQIKKSSIIPPQDESEIFSILTEMLLETLCYTNPKILDKKESEYVQA